MEMYGYSFQREEDLMHYGLKGMKWGVRRWQNSDGSFNEAGKKRYFGEGSGENYRSVGRKAIVSANKTAKEKRANKAQNSSKLKTAAKIGVAVAGTALVAYGGYKLNQALNGEVGRHYKELGNQWYDKAGKALIRAEGYAGGGFHNPNKSSIQNTSESFERAMAKENLARAKEYMTKSRQGSYSTREKIDALKRMASHR